MSNIPLSELVKKPFVPVYCSWTGASGALYQFQLDALGSITYFPMSGVYIFSRDLGGGSHYPVYVGETDSFQRRLTDQLWAHHALDAIRKHGATHINTLSIAGDRAKRLYVETDLRNALNPPCNKQ
ncbi:hypothetical protein [Bradyrhizobium sp. Gha]|uniref:hypothetical protein n=1 Tax=Bradyrhizobium sp. Gha TaxID=1855318 RepID=UPI0008ECDB1A|nr:hypothetical protein [Bradyrhizobium sp. Gha]SFJ00407.1 hypothetical protein SAMN05216525_11716 [Bradyrhizobium sp. Gha]